MIDLSASRACRRHRSALLDFVDRGEIAVRTGPALAHLDRCDRCTSQIESTVLTIIALRRLGEDLAQAEPSPDVWPRLRARLERWRPFRWSVMSPSAGVVVSAAIVAVLVAPLQIGSPQLTGAIVEPTVAPIQRAGASPEERRIEAEYIASTRRSLPPSQTIVVSRPAGVVQPTVSIPRNYPDNIRPERKEVTPAQPSGRPPEAI